MEKKLKLTKYKKILVSGCSFTNKDYESAHNPNIDVSWPKWPEILGKQLDCEVINLGFSGAGNEYISSTILDNIDKYNPDLVIAAWSQSQRKDYMSHNRWNNILYDMYGDMEYFINKSLRTYYLMQEYFKFKKIKYCPFQMLPIYSINSHSLLKDEEKKLVSKIILKSVYHNKIDDSFIGWPCEKTIGGFTIKDEILKGYSGEGLKYQISEMDTHPNKKGHELIAEFLYDRLG